MSTFAVASHHFSILVPILWGPVGLGFWVAVSWLMNRGQKDGRS